MAFCPNCGTPNTDQAAKCVSCAFELAPAQKAKFKGTIMMTGVQAPQSKPGGNPQVPAATPKPSSAQPAQAAPGRNMAFEKTMLGPMGAAPLSAPPAASTSAASPSAPEHPSSLGIAPTVESPSPHFTPPQSVHPSTPTPSLSLSGGGFGNATGSFGEDDAPSLPKPNTNKVVAIGCVVVLVVTGVIATIMFSMIKQKLFTTPSDEEAVLAWRDRLGQALTAVSVACEAQCEGVEKYFHASVSDSLLPQAKLLSQSRLAKFLPPAEATAQMLSDSEDTELATKLGLDPSLCVELSASGASAVACSVPMADGKSELRIVHLAGVEGL